MGAFDLALRGMNAIIRDIFAEVDSTSTPIIATYQPKAGRTTIPVPPGPPLPIEPFTIQLVPLDPIRQEETNPGNFTLRWADRADFDAVSYLPIPGDSVVINAVTYKVEQCAVDAGRGVRLLLQKAASV